MDPVVTDPGRDLAAPATPLNATENRVLSYAAAMGKEFRFDILALVTEMEEEALAEVLEGLVHQGVIKEFAGGDLYAFVREETRAQAYGSVSSSRLRIVHRRIAESYDRVYAGEPPPEVIAEMGRHFHLGKVTDQSLMYNRYAATLARESFSPETAMAYLDRVVEDLATLPGEHALEESEVAKELGDLLMDLGEAGRAYDRYQKALAKAPGTEPTLRATILLSLADAAREAYRLKVAREHGEAALVLFEATANREGLAMAHRVLSRVALMDDRPQEARRETEKALSLLDPDTERKSIARCYLDLANASSTSADPEEQRRTLAFNRKAIETLEPLEDWNELFRAHNNLAVAIGMEDAPAALAELEAAQDCAVRSRNRRNVGWTLFNRVEFLLAVGRDEEAARSNRKAEDLLSKLDDPLGMQQVVLNQGILAQKKGDLAAAERAYLDSLARAQALGRPQIISEMYIRLALLYDAWEKGEARAQALAEVKALGEDKVAPAYRAQYAALLERSS